MRRVVATGANRGIGLEFVRQLLARGDRVIAACRDPQRADALRMLADAHPDRLYVRMLDVADAASIAAFADGVARTFDGADLLINNAGIAVRGERFGSVGSDVLTSTLNTNAIGPFLLAQALASLLAKGTRPIVANISSRVGSIALTKNFFTPSYAISKAALNMASVLLASGMAASGICVVVFTPGWVRTDMGGADAPLAASDAVGGLLDVIDRLRPEDSGRFLDHQGESVPW